ncbi:WD40 repeat domain-containing protein [Streptomyces olivochromogenes]|uniref:WD40 repeat domain-containing protein n=1 Tax=Streptomyces olivochromogenes TaxID=1963 RepID=UPI00369BDF19
MTPNDAVGSGSYEGALRELGEALTELKRQRGVPSYDRLRLRGTKLLGATGASSKATLSSVFAGRQYISLDRLMWLVRTMLSYLDGEEGEAPQRDNPKLEAWRARWYVLDAARTAARRQTAAARPVTPEAFPEPRADVLPEGQAADHVAPPVPPRRPLAASPVSSQSRVTGFVPISDPLRIDAVDASSRRAVQALAISPSGWIAAVGADLLVRLWDPALHPHESVRLGSDDEEVLVVAFSSDDCLRTLSVDGIVRFWDPQLRVQLSSGLAGDSKSPVGGAFSLDGRLLARCDPDGFIWLWDLDIRATVGNRFSDNGAWPPVTALAFSPQGLLASGDGQGGVQLWDSATQAPIGDRLAASIEPSAPVRALAFSPDQQLLASCDAHGLLRLWDLDARTAIANPFPGDDIQGVQAVAFSADGLLVTGDADGLVRLWDQATPQPVPSPSMPLAAHMVLYGMRRGQPTEFRPRLHHGSPVLDIAFSPDGRLLATGESDGVLHLWDPTTRTEVSSFLHHHGPVRTVDFMPDGVIATGDDYGVRFSAQHPHLDRSRYLTGNIGGIYAVALSSDSRLLAVADASRIQLWDASTRLPIGVPLHIPEISPQAVAFSPTGKLLATRGKEGVQLWDPQTGLRRSSLGSRIGQVQAMAFSPDGRLLAAAGEGGVQLWGSTGAWRGGVLVNEGGVRTVAFSPDGRLLAEAGDDGVVVRNPLTRAPLTRFINETGSVQAIAFSPDSSVLAVASGNEVLLVG